MKFLIFITGALAGIALAGASVYADRQLNRYANHSLPQPEYVGPKYIYWKNGARVRDVI